MDQGRHFHSAVVCIVCRGHNTCSTRVVCRVHVWYEWYTCGMKGTRAAGTVDIHVYCKPPTHAEAIVKASHVSAFYC